MRFALPRRHRIGNNGQPSVPRCIRCPPARRAYFPRCHRSIRAGLAEFSIRFTASYPAGGASVAAIRRAVAPVKSVFASVAPSVRAVHGFGPSVQVTRPRGQPAESKAHANDSVRPPDLLASPAVFVHRVSELSSMAGHRNPSSGLLSDAAGSAVTVVSALEFLASRVKRRMFDRRQRRGDRRKGAPLVRQFSPVSRRGTAYAPGRRPRWLEFSSRSPAPRFARHVCTLGQWPDCQYLRHCR